MNGKAHNSVQYYRILVCLQHGWILFSCTMSNSNVSVFALVCVWVVFFVTKIGMLHVVVCMCASIYRCVFVRKGGERGGGEERRGDRMTKEK